MFHIHNFWARKKGPTLTHKSSAFSLHLFCLLLLGTRKCLDDNMANYNFWHFQVYGHDPVSFVVPCLDRPKEFMIGRGRDLCRLHWDFDQEPRKQDRSCKSDHWVVVMENVDRQLFNNRFNDGKCDPLGRLFAGKKAPFFSYFSAFSSICCFKKLVCLLLINSFVSNSESFKMSSK